MVYNKKYDWKYDMPVKAQTAGEYLEGLEKEHGSLTPKIIVDNSRQENDVLHKCFEWEDEIAAEKYRKEQARLLLGNLVVVVEESNTKESTVRAFVNIRSAESSKFISINKVFEDEDMETQMFQTALKELKSFQKKYSVLTALAPIFKEIDNLTIDYLFKMDEDNKLKKEVS